VLNIDVSANFIDPDSDKLIYTTTLPENIQVSVSGSIITLTPKPNWFGTEYIVITADDGRGGITSTNRITLIVQDVVEPDMVNSLRQWFIDLYKEVEAYYQYIIYGILIFIVLFLLIRYNKQIVNFFLEDEPRKKK